MATESSDSGWFGGGTETGAIKGRLFAWACLAATLFGIGMVMILLVYVVLDAFAIGQPNTAPWLDWGFLTNATSRFPEQAGLYPASVGSVMMRGVMERAALPVFTEISRNPRLPMMARRSPGATAW